MSSSDQAFDITDGDDDSGSYSGSFSPAQFLEDKSSDFICRS